MMPQPMADTLNHRARKILHAVVQEYLHTGDAGPVAVWSPDALKDRIVAAEELDS